MTVNAEDEPDIIPAENGAAHLIELRQIERIGYGDPPNDHGAQLVENSS
jgi:hypothetical protein